MLTLTDLFCGGGGSSTGATQVPGVKIRMAANHWDLAVEVHNQNHPDADHAAVDLHEEDPRYFPRTDILWASPECTKWSSASGGRYAAVSTEANLLDPDLVDEDPERAKEIKAWAVEVGLADGIHRGQVPMDLVHAYAAAHPESVSS